MNLLVIPALFVAVSMMAQTSAPSPAKAKPAKPVKSAAKPKVPAAKPASAPVVSVAGKEKPILTIGSEQISAAEFEEIIEGLPQQYQAQARGPMKRQIAEEIIKLRLLANEARKRGLDKEKTVQSRIAFQTENLLAGAAFSDMLKQAKVEDTAVQKYYDAHQNEYQQAQVRHILIKFKGSPVPQREGKPELSEEQALAKVTELKKRIAGGEDFAKLAQAESDDTGSGANGGDLGMFKKGSMVPAFEQVAFSAPIGEISEPVKTQFGYHIIRVDKRESKPLAEVRSQIENQIRPEVAKQNVEELRKTANVQFDEAFFGPPTPAPSAAPGAGAPPPAPGAAK